MTQYQKKLNRIMVQVRSLLDQNNPHLRREFADLLAAELDRYIALYAKS